jgi:hypothetical protein
MTVFRMEIENAINRHSMENGSDTPDFILADYLCDCLAAFDRAVGRRNAWGSPPNPTDDPGPVGPPPEAAS